jgi:hypothetical protein
VRVVSEGGDWVMVGSGSSGEILVEAMEGVKPAVKK